MVNKADTWIGGSLVIPSVSIRKRSLLLVLAGFPAIVPLIFISRGWLLANPREVLTKTEADVLGTGGEICFFAAVSITPIITLTGARWIAPLRRWYGIMFAVIGIADSITAAITGDFAGGVIGRLAGHTFLLAGFLIILLALPLLATANTPAQRKLGKYWKRLHKVTYVIWGLIVVHLLLLDGLTPFSTPGCRRCAAGSPSSEPRAVRRGCGWPSRRWPRSTWPGSPSSSTRRYSPGPWRSRCTPRPTDSDISAP